MGVRAMQSGLHGMSRPMARSIRRGKAMPAILVREVEGRPLRNQLATLWSAYTVWLCVRQPQEDNRQDIDRLTRVLRLPGRDARCVDINARRITEFLQRQRTTDDKLSSTEFDEVSREQ
jgi:hypothetical protein